MKRTVLLILTLPLGHFFVAQPTLDWQKALGGTMSENAQDIHQTADGGYIVAGTANSADGDVADPFGGEDCWVVKLNSSGGIDWQKSYGGSGNDEALSIQQTADGGYIMAGASDSVDGDVTGNHGLFDYWIVKIDSDGFLEWQKSLGGTLYDVAFSIRQLTGGGYIIAGYSGSNDGDVSGNHGAYDCWVVEINAIGEIQSQACYGGTSLEEATDIQQTADGGYIVGGWTDSDDGDVTGYHGTITSPDDYWIFKLDSSGSMEWNRCLGGTDADIAQSIQQTTDGGYIVGGYSWSADGDVTDHNGPVDIAADYWIVKLDSSGDLDWEKSLGGTGTDVALSARQTNGGGYVVVGESASTDGDVTGIQGDRDYWIVQLDGTGEIQWQKSYGGTMYDGATAVEQTADGGFIITGNSYSPDGDVVGVHGTTWDYWVVKLSVPIGVDEINGKDPTISVYSNPLSGILTITFDPEIQGGILTIFNDLGKSVYSEKISGGICEVSSSSFTAGTYFAQVNRGKKIQSKKFVIQ